MVVVRVDLFNIQNKMQNYVLNSHTFVMEI
jgi:hypothetical protein